MTDLQAEPPFFIVGCGRDGTTLVQTMLVRHPRLTVPWETHYMKFADRFGAETADAPEDFAGFWSALTGWRRFTDLSVDPERVLELAEEEGGRSFRGVFAGLLRACAERDGAARVGEKTPGHLYYLDRLFAWFPGARIVAMQRDPRAVLASHLRAPWIVEETKPASAIAPVVRRLRLLHAAERARLWRDAYAVHLAGVGADPRIKLVRYERLVQDPEGVMREVCGFLGETFDPVMLSGKETSLAQAGSAEGPDSWRAAHERRAAAPVSTGSLEKWRDELSPLEIAAVEGAASDTMREAGYEPAFAGAQRRLGRHLGGALLPIARAERGVRDAAYRIASRAGLGW